MASAHPDSMALLQSIEVDPDRRIDKFLSENATFNIGSPKDDHTHDHFSSTFEHIHGSGPMQDDFGGDLDGVDAMITMDSTTKMAGKTVAPFLAKHIPDQYAPLGAPALASASQKDPNTKYCYRHRPDSKCRRTADEPTMEILQRNLETLSQADQQGISHVWSLFSAAPAKHRDLMLQGILTQCCFPQLSYLSSQVRDLIRIDFLSALPSEISFKILCYLDTTSLCKAAQVSQRWRILADDDVVWHKMCEQHIDRKCTKCGWGLPLLERKRLRDWKRQQQLRASGRGLNEWSPQLTPAPEENSNEFLKTLVFNGPTKRTASSLASETSLSASSSVHKRQRIEEAKPTTKFRPWKDVYKDRFKVGTNWKYGRCSTKTFRGHTNGVMCLQFDDNILATGSYDTTIKIWNMDTGDCIRTLRGHTSGIRTLQFDDTKLISGSLDRTIKVWNWRTGECISTLDGHTEGVVAVHFEGQYIVSGSIDKTVRVYDFKDKKTQTLTGHKDWVNSVKVDSHSRTLFSASDDCTIRLWDLDTMKTIRVFEGHVGQVQQVILLPAEYEPDEADEDVEDGSTTSTERSSTPHPPEPSTFANWLPCRPKPARYMMTAGLDSTVRLWDVESGRCIKTFFGHVEGVWALAADSLRVVSGAEDRMVKVWDARSGRCQRTFTGHAGPVTCVGLSDSRMVTGSEDCEIRLYSFKSDDGAEFPSVHGDHGAGATTTTTTTNPSTPSSSAA